MLMIANWAAASDPLRRELFDSVAAHARAQPAKLAAKDLATGADFTYAALDERIGRCAAILTGRLGDNSGARVAMLARNCVDLIVLHYACARAGCIFMPLNWRLAAAELGVQAADAEPSLLLHQEEFARTAEALAANAPSLALLRMDGAFEEALRAAAPGPIGRGALVNAEAPIMLLYTSGTSGRPKGVIVTEKSAFFTSINFALGVRMGPDGVYLCDMPLFHVAALLGASRPTLLMGGTLLISPQFDPPTTLRRISDATLGVTHYFCVPQMAQMLRLDPFYPQADFSRIVCFTTGGAPNPAALVRRWVEDGVPMSDGFGMTEAGGALSMPIGDLGLIARKAGSIGVPSLVMQARIVDDEGRDAADGEVGELWLRGPNVTPGYWRRPGENARTFQEGWLKTGDAARRDADGFYYLVDRKKDMYISGGENVYPAEVEAVIVELPEVAEAAVVGVPDERWGEVGCAFLAAKPGAAISPENILSHCRDRLAGYKLPRSVRIIETLPRTASGKVQKHVLKALWLSEAGAAPPP
jgi:fatty-acyl-CoA synthase